MTDEIERLGDLHDDNGYDRERKPDDVHFPREIFRAETEHFHHAGREQHERDERDRDQRDDIEHFVGERSDLEERMPRAHIVRVERLRERKHKEGRRASPKPYRAIQ